MEFVYGFAILSGLGLAIAFAVLVHRLLVPPAASPDLNWCLAFSASKYRPMESLLGAADLRFLRAQRGFDPALERRLRSERVEIFHLYLAALVRDFWRLHRGVRMLAASSSEPELALSLMKQALLFRVALAGVRLRLVLYGWSLTEADLSIGGVMESVREMQRQIQALAPAAQPAAA